MGKSCDQHDFFSLGGQYYSLGQSSVDNSISVYLGFQEKE